GMSYLAQASTADRDQQAHTNALTYFRNLADRFPTSPWAEKARLRVIECREALAKHEADIAKYYLQRKNLKAAEARLRGLLTEVPRARAHAGDLADVLGAVPRARRARRCFPRPRDPRTAPPRRAGRPGGSAPPRRRERPCGRRRPAAAARRAHRPDA